MQAYLQTDPYYAPLFKNVWLWTEFPARQDFGGKDTGIDLDALTHNGDYWAVQCKFFQENSTIDKPTVDTFLSTSGSASSSATRRILSGKNRPTTTPKTKIPEVGRLRRSNLCQRQPSHVRKSTLRCDAYIKAFRWSFDRLDKKHGGIIAYVSNGAWLDSNGMDGFRKCLQREFSAIYIFNLRGNQRTSGELSRKEGGKIFGSGSRTPIAITFLVKKLDEKGGAGATQIFYHDIGDYLSRDEKLGIDRKFQSVENLPFIEIQPNEHGDWISLRDDLFGTWIPVEPEEKFDGKAKSFFLTHSLGLAPGRDAWVYNFSKSKLAETMRRSIAFFNEQSLNFKIEKGKNSKLEVDEFIDTDPTKISWNRNLKQDLEKFKNHKFNQIGVVVGHYRPFCKSNLYFDKDKNAMVYQTKRLFPTPNTQNRVICVSGVGVTKDFSCIITDIIPDLELIGKSQCFPLHYFEQREKQSPTLFDGAGEQEQIRRDGVSDWILGQARSRYGDRVGKEDVFYYVYGFLHHPVYRERFAADLKKMLPRLPQVEEPRDFWAFSKAGRALADLHLGYDDFTKAVSAEAIGVRIVGLGIWDWASLHQSQIPNPQSQIPTKLKKCVFPRKRTKARYFSTAKSRWKTSRRRPTNTS